MSYLPFFSRWKKLKSLGVLGMNKRNHSYINKYNKRSIFPLVDNKLLSKKLAMAHGIAVPKLIDVVSTEYDISRLKPKLDCIENFVIKPAKGSGGKGIVAITHMSNGCYIKSNGDRLTFPDIKRHMSNILAGLYSLGGNSDVAMIEELINSESRLKSHSVEGVPDIRTIVFKGFPVMSMLRLATHNSDGKANLHQGAVGVGLDIATGRGVGGVQFDRIIKHHPDTNAIVKDIVIPSWHSNLELSASCYEMTSLGYLGVDVVLDSNHGPVILELNARPGLSIQIANGEGLLSRLRKIEKVTFNRPKFTLEERVDYSINNFASSLKA